MDTLALQCKGQYLSYTVKYKGTLKDTAFPMTFVVSLSYSWEFVVGTKANKTFLIELRNLDMPKLSSVKRPHVAPTTFTAKTVKNIN